MDAGGRATQDAYMDIGGTTTRKWEVELRLEQQPRATQEQLPRAMQDDSMDGIGRVASGAKAEWLPRSGALALSFLL